MNLLTIVLIAVGLAMDAFAASIAKGTVVRKSHFRHALLIAALFGFFQGIMPLLGWQLGRFAQCCIEFLDHWVAFVLLVFIGGKMIVDAGKKKDEKPIRLRVLLLLAVATSIDAFAVGVSLSFLDVSILRPVFVIGGVTFLFSFAGVYIGYASGHLFEKKIEILGGIILIGMGVKILVESLLAG